MIENTNKTFPKMWMSTLLKDLSTVCRANFVGYNKNFSDGIEDHRISNHSEERESKIGECVKM